MSTMPPEIIGQPPAQCHEQPVLVQLWDLFQMELTNWRWSWRGSVLSGVLVPMFSIFALGVFAQDLGQNTLTYVLTGNVVVGLIFGTMNNVQGRVMWMRFQGGLDYIATLPVRRAVFVLAMVMAFLLLSLPSVLITMLLGPLIFDISIQISPLLILVVPFAATSLAGLGALIGLSGRTQQTSRNIEFIVSFFLSGIGPVVIPPDRLPKVLLWLGHLSPATYAASALRQTMVGPVTAQLGWDMLVLGGMTVLFMVLVSAKMQWHEG